MDGAVRFPQRESYHFHSWLARDRLVVSFGMSALVAFCGASSVHYMYVYVNTHVLMSVDRNHFNIGRDER